MSIELYNPFGVLSTVINVEPSWAAHNLNRRYSSFSYFDLSSVTIPPSLELPIADEVLLYILASFIVIKVFPTICKPYLHHWKTSNLSNATRPSHQTAALKHGGTSFYAIWYFSIHGGWPTAMGSFNNTIRKRLGILQVILVGSEAFKCF